MTASRRGKSQAIHRFILRAAPHFMVIKVRCQTGALIAHRTADTSYKNNNMRLQRRGRRCPSKGRVEINCKATIPQYIVVVNSFIQNIVSMLVCVLCGYMV